MAMRRSIDDQTPFYNLVILIYYCKDFTTRYLQTIGHMEMFVVKSTVIQINGRGYGSFNSQSLMLTTLCKNGRLPFA